MDSDQFRTWIMGRIGKTSTGSQVQYADENGIDRSVMSLVLTGRREPSKEFAEALGFKRQVRYVRAKKPSLPSHTASINNPKG